MPSLGQLENATLKEMERTRPVHRGMLDLLPGAPRVSEVVRVAMAAIGIAAPTRNKQL
jgi:hypothetical protein